MKGLSERLRGFICPTIEDEVLMAINLPKQKHSVIGQRIKAKALEERYEDA